MALWNKVVSGFDKEEETVNFGARIVAENNGSLYETSTLATIQSDEQVITEPNILACVQYSRVCVAIDKSVTIFENETCEEILLSISFGLLITSCCISDDGTFLFVALSNSTLYCHHLLNKGQLIFTRNFPKDVDSIIKIFLQTDCNDEYINVYLTTKRGIIYRLSKFNAKCINATIPNATDNDLKELTDQIECVQLFNGFTNNEVKYATVGIICDKISVAMLCPRMLFMWPNEQCVNLKGMFYKYTKVKFFNNSTSMLVLRTDHSLTIVCPWTLLGIKVYDEPVYDFTIIENNNNNSCQIIILTTHDKDSITRFLRVLSFPDFKQKFQINVPSTTYLVDIMDNCNELVLFLERVSGIGNNNKCTDTVRIKTVTESIPEYQLQRLIRRKQFEAAEIFARKYNLSREPIYCMKVALLVSQFGPWAKEACDLVQLEALINILDKIENVQYVVECCSKALIPEYKQMRKIHLYARTRIVESTEKMRNDEHLNLLYTINSTLHKLETFHMIWGYRNDSEYYDDDTMKEWIRFSRANLMEEYRTHLSLSKMESATLIWTRHLPDIMKYVSIEAVKDIFTILPEKIIPSTLWPWLLNFVPSLLSIIPGVISEIIVWGCAKIKSLEKSHHSAWPQIGIDFANKFIKLLRFEDNYQSLYSYQECLNTDSNLKQLVLLIQAMSDIQKLKTNYRLIVPLDLYTLDSIEVSHVLLDRIHVDIIREFVNTFFKQYMLNNSLQEDQILSSYIQKTMRNSKSWWSGQEAPWEKRVVAIIDLIQNIETRLKQTLDVLKKASVPWSPTMTTLAETNSNLDHALATEIRIEYNYVPIKLVLKKYGYERIGTNNKLIFRIIKENNDDMISDIQQITKNDPTLRKKAFSSCVNYYLTRGNVEKVMEIFHCLETDVLFYCCVQIVNYVMASLTLKNIPKSLIHYVEMLGCVKLHLEEISKNCKNLSSHCSSVIINIDEINSIYLLREEFGINVTLKEYQIEKMKILENSVQTLCNLDRVKNDNDFLVIYKKSIKVASLLKLRRLDAIHVLLDRTKIVDVLKYFVNYQGGNLIITEMECQRIRKVCSLLLEHARLDAEIVTIIYNLSCSILCVCPARELRSNLMLYTWVSLYQECISKNVKYCLNVGDAKQEEERTLNWKLYTIYKDLALAADEFLLPLYRDTISVQKLCMSDSKSDILQVETEDTAQNCDEQGIENVLENLLRKMSNLRVEHNDYSLLQIAKALYLSSCATPKVNSTLLIKIQSMYFHFITTLLKRLLSTRTFDVQLGLSCLFMLPVTEASKWISSATKSLQQDCARHLRISVLAYEYFRLTKNQTFIKLYEDNRTLHCWAQRLSKYFVSYKEILTSDTMTRREILERIMTCPNDNIVSQLQDFCRDFAFDIQDCLLLYLKTVIKSWNPKFHISNYNGRKELQIDKTEVNELREKCNDIADKVKDKAALKTCIAASFSEINFYHYDIFIILMDLIEDRNVEHRNYFCFLQNYTRVGQPTQIERDAWRYLNPGHTSLPPIAEWRLPFLPKTELWKLITPELNLKTYEKWLDIAPILKLQSHIVCTLAIKGEVSLAWGDMHKNDKWALCSKNSSLLNEIKKCIERMTDPDALYYGTAALYYVVNHTPPGADQVAAVQECYKYAQLSAQKSTTFEEGMLEKIKFKYTHFTSEHILRTHGLGKKNYLSLIGNPHKLIRELYTDESIPQRYRCVTDHRPDINSAVNAISQLFSINMVKLRMELLQEWLEADMKYTKFNQSVTDTFSMTTHSESNSNHEDNLLRACYILKCQGLELLANFLINIGFDDNNEDYSLEARFRALCVLQIIVNATELEDLTKRDSETIRNYMKHLKYIGKLELLGVGYSINAFKTCSKHELVQILWKTQSFSPQALIVIAQICADFKIYDYSLWDGVLSQLAKLLMINELKKILLQVRNISVIVNSSGYLLGWQTIVSEPFRKMDIHPSSEQLDNCTKTLQLLHSCPVVHMLFFDDVINYCFQCQQPHLAVAFMPFLNDNNKQYVLEKIKKAFTVAKVLEDLNSLSFKGVLCVSYCSRILQNTLKNGDT